MFILVGPKLTVEETGVREFIYVLLVKRVMAGQPTCLQTASGRTYCLNSAGAAEYERGVPIPLEVMQEPGMCLLVDGDETDGQPNSSWCQDAPKTPIIMTAPICSAADRGWLERKSPSGWEFVMPTWSEVELFILGCVLGRTESRRDLTSSFQPLPH